MGHTVGLVAALAMFSSSAVLVSGCGSKDDGRADVGEAVAKVAEFKDRMCACKDKDCATKVNDDYTIWGTAMANKMASHKDTIRPDEMMAKKMTEVAMAYGECMTRAMTTLEQRQREPSSPDYIPPDAPPPVDASPYAYAAPLAPSKPIDADQMIRSAIDWTNVRRAGAVLGRIQIDYVGTDGKLDDADGTMLFVFGLPVDDPKRKIGAPVKHPSNANECFHLLLTNGTWAATDEGCAPTVSAKPACMVAEIMRKAVAGGAPDGALAKVEWHGPKPAWEVIIEDEPRNIHFQRSFVDDCPVKLEETPK